MDFFTSLLNVVCEMAPYLLLGFLIAGVLHVFTRSSFTRTPFLYIGLHPQTDPPASGASV